MIFTSLFFFILSFPLLSAGLSFSQWVLGSSVQEMLHICTVLNLYMCWDHRCPLCPLWVVAALGLPGRQFQVNGEPFLLEGIQERFGLKRKWCAEITSLPPLQPPNPHFSSVNNVSIAAVMSHVVEANFSTTRTEMFIKAY